MKQKSSSKINFELAGNIMIIPLEINGVTLSFVLDTGVNKAILFNLTDRDSLQVRSTEKIYLRGLGSEGQIEALKSKKNTFKIGNAIGFEKELYVLLDNNINFTPRLGFVVHGIIGYDLFKDFIVEINYSSKFIRLHKPETFNVTFSKKWGQKPIEIINNKPFVTTNINIHGANKKVKLLIDTGSSDALWLFENKEREVYPDTTKMFYDFLGRGLSGSVYGQRSRISQLTLGDFELNDVNVAFPDATAIDKSRIIKNRDGSLGGNILKRFHLFFDYQRKQLYFKKNNFFKTPFTYNNSGIVVEHNGTQFVKEAIRLPFLKGHSNNAIIIDRVINYFVAAKPIYKIVEMRQSSNAYKVGLRINDVLVKLNGKPTYDYQLPEINALLHGKTGKTLRLQIARNGIVIPFKFKLDNAFKKETPSK